MTARTHIRILTQLGLTLATIGLLVSLPLSATAAPAAEPAAGPCSVGGGVTVVVDFSDVGGSVTTECAEGEPTTGRDALVAAGFIAEDSAPGMICTINATPDPCPETFDGSYWSYWHALPGEAWTGYLVGADTSVPLTGEVEGWRYNDGSVGPGDGTAPELNTSADVSTTLPSAGVTTSTDSVADSSVMLIAIAFGFLVLLIIAAIVLAPRLRSRTRP